MGTSADSENTTTTTSYTVVIAASRREAHKMASFEHQKHVCFGLCDAVKATRLGDLRSTAAEHGLELPQAWHAPTPAQGFIVAAERYWNGTEHVLVVAFRGTQGHDEWMEYPKEYVNGTRFMRHEGMAAEGFEVFSVWPKTLNQVRLARLT